MQVVYLMYLELKDVPGEDLEEAMENYILCYDDMCQLDSLKAAKEDLSFPCLPHSTWCGETSGKLLIDYIWRTTNILSVRKCTVPMKPFLLVTTPWLQSKHSPGFPDSRKLSIPCHRHITFSLFIGTSNAETLILKSAEGKASNLSSQESMPSSYQNWHK